MVVVVVVVVVETVLRCGGERLDPDFGAVV